MTRAEIKLGRWKFAVELGRTSANSRANYYETNIENWQEALSRSTGYDTQLILDKVISATREVCAGRAAYERDTVTFQQPQVVYPLVSWLMYTAATHKHLRVMDFGGSLGSLYYQHRQLLDPINDFAWGVVEQEHIVQVGQAEFETNVLHFYSTIQECVEAIRPNFVLLSSVLQYIENPYELLDQIFKLDAPYIFIDRTMAQYENLDSVAIQHVQPIIYKASYPVWFLDAHRLEGMFASYNYKIIDKFDPYPGSTFGAEGNDFPYQSWFLSREK